MAWIKKYKKNSTDKAMTIEMAKIPHLSLDDIFKGVKWEKSGGTKQLAMACVGLILALDIKTIIEIGCWQGFSANILGRALAANAGKEGLLISCDINPNALARAKDATKHFSIQHETFEGSSLDFNPSKFLGSRKCGLAFVDGNHNYDFALADLKTCSRVASQNGIIAVHDYSANHPQHKDVVKATNEFISFGCWQKFYIPENRISTDYHSVILQREV